MPTRASIAPTLENTEAPSLTIDVFDNADEIHMGDVLRVMPGKTMMLEYDGASYIVRVMGKRVDGGARLVLMQVD